jgi:iron complex transport system permease protein
MCIHTGRATTRRNESKIVGNAPEQETQALGNVDQPEPAEAGRGFSVLRPPRVFVPALLAALAASAAAGVLVGRGGTLDGALAPIFLAMRAQRTAVAFLSGAALSLAGVVLQGLFRNPLASPNVLGTSAGALLGAHVALLASVTLLGGGSLFGVAPEMMTPIGALLGACSSLLVLLAVVSLRVSPLVLLLTGWSLMMVFSGIGTFLHHLYQEAWELNRAISALSVGSISAAGPRQVLLALVMTLGGAVPVLLSAPTLDVLLTGEEEAASLGVDVARERFWLVLWVSVLTAGAVAVGGNVGFVGLIVPHALRPWVGQRHRYLLPAALLAGGTFVVLCDVICRLLPARVDLPLGALTDLIGAPLFLRMLIKLARAERLHD